MKPSHRQDHALFVRCHDTRGRRRDFTVAINEHGQVVVGLVGGESAVLGHLEVGRVRGLLRDAVIAAAEGCHHPDRVMSDDFVASVARMRELADEMSRSASRFEREIGELIMMRTDFAEKQRAEDEQHGDGGEA